MERKNTVLLTVIAVATLLVAVVGATFAYFTATNSSTGNGEEATVNAGSADEISLAITPESISNGTIYPGMKIATGVTLKATTTGSDTYTVAFDIKAKIDTSAWTSSKSKLKYTLYSSDTEVSEPITSGSCKRTEDTTTQSGETRISYTGCTEDVQLVAVGSSQEVNAGGLEEITIQNAELKIDTGATKHYYLVVEYVNEAETDQTGTDAGKALTIQITETTNTKATQKTA